MSQSVVVAFPKKKRAPRLNLPVPIPDWIPPDAWAAFLDNRKALRAFPTPHAQVLLVQKLGELVAAGGDARAILDQSTMNSWRGLFAVKSDCGVGGRLNRSEILMASLKAQFAAEEAAEQGMLAND